MSKKFVIHGKASKKNILLPFPEECWDHQTLLKFLQYNKIPMASSCNGEGLCLKCVVNEKKPSCQISMLNLKKEYSPHDIIITVDYL